MKPIYYLNLTSSGYQFAKFLYAESVLGAHFHFILSMLGLYCALTLGKLLAARQERAYAEEEA